MALVDAHRPCFIIVARGTLLRSRSPARPARNEWGVIPLVSAVISDLLPGNNAQKDARSHSLKRFADGSLPFSGSNAYFPFLDPVILVCHFSITAAVNVLVTFPFASYASYVNAFNFGTAGNFTE